MNYMYGNTLQAVRRERAARSETGLTGHGWKSRLNFLVRSALIKSLVRAFSLAAIGTLLAAVALVAIATMPSLFGYHTYTIDGDSMEPTLEVGDAAITKPASSTDLKVGNVIVRRDNQGGPPMLHRIVEIVTVDGQLAFITQGDQNSAPDAQPVFLSGSGEQVIYSVPYAGYLLNFAGSWPGRILLIGLPLVLLAAALAGNVRRAIQPRTRAAKPRTNAPAPAPMPAAFTDISHLADQLNSWALRRFVLRHSGAYRRIRQCAQHPPIADTTTLQILAAFKDETGLAATSQRLAETCAELGVPYARASSIAKQASELVAA